MKKRILKLFVYSNLLLCVLILSAGVGEVSAHFIPNNRNRDPGLRDKNSLLWETDKDNLPADERYDERKAICPKVFAGLKYQHYGKMSVRMCELAAIGHPNIEGSKAYAEAIKTSLRTIL